MRLRLPAALALVLVVAACDFFAYMLELHVSNESAADATLEIVEGAGADPEADAFVHFTEVIESGEERDVDVERPGPGGWTVIVNGHAVTDSAQWPSDNPTIDLAVYIRVDGSIDVVDE